MQSSLGGSRPPWLLRFRSSTVFIVATVWISSFTDYFLYAMVVPILPTALSERANVPYEDREYWVSVLLMSEAIAAFICCPIFGYIVDVAPTRRLPYVLGLILLGASMGLLAVARSVTMFVMARLLQGGATAMILVAGLALLTDSVPLDNLGQTLGYQGSAVALGFMLGPLLGGVVYEAAGYGVVFGMAFALVGVDLVMRVVVVEKKVAARWLESELKNESESEDDDDDGALEDSILAARDGGGYQTFPNLNRPLDEESQDEGLNEHIQRQEPEQSIKGPTILQIAKQPRVVISSFGLLVQGLLFSAFDATIPIFVENTFKWTPLGAGVAFLPSALTAILEPFFGYIADKYGPRIPTFTSFFLLPLPLVAMCFVSKNKASHIALLLTLLTVVGLLINLATPALYLETQDVLESLQAKPQSQSQSETLNAPHQDNRQTQTESRPPSTKHLSQLQPRNTSGIAQAFGIQTMAQFLGMFLGSLMGGFLDWRFGWGIMVFSLGGLCFVSCWGMLALGKTESSAGLLGQGWLRRLLKRGKRKRGGGETREEEGGEEGEREGLMDGSL
ncbi:major facilitator superfamily domain-containing protein [Aspergillus crustosus]